MMEPAVGASVWASGSQEWNGKMGTFTAKARKKPRKSRFCAPAKAARPAIRSGRANVPLVMPM